MYLIGTGTFGRVYLVRHRPTSKYYAMKTLRKTEVVRLKQVEHINSEKQILSSIRHPFIVNLYVLFPTFFLVNYHNTYRILDIGHFKTKNTCL
jgi:serine/threonine protein kinase